MDALKQEVRDTVVLMLKHAEDAERYGIEWNGKAPTMMHGRGLLPSRRTQLIGRDANALAFA